MNKKYYNKYSLQSMIPKCNVIYYINNIPKEFGIKTINIKISKKKVIIFLYNIYR